MEDNKSNILAISGVDEDIYIDGINSAINFKTIKHKGHEFSFDLSGILPIYLYLVAKAEEGDEAADAILKDFDVKITDMHGSTVYPIKEEENG